MIVGDRGINITLGGLSNLCLEFEEQVDKMEKHNEELELLTEKLLEENATLKEIVQGQNSDLDKNTEEILRLENKISDLECIGINTDEIYEDYRGEL